MLVCHCHAVCDRTIRRHVADGARSGHEIRRACGAGGGCGGCRPVIEELIELHGVRSDVASASRADT